MQETPVARLARLWATRNDHPRKCGYRDCDEIVTARQSAAEGHRDFCSDEHAALDQQEAFF